MVGKLQRLHAEAPEAKRAPKAVARRAPPAPRPACALAVALFLALPVRATALNVLIVVADDLGVDAVSAYDEHPAAAPTPTLEALAAQGVLFRAAWANPICSPSRASLLTGSFPRTHGVGANVREEGGLDTNTVTIADVAKASGYTTFAVGKWHLTPRDRPMTAPLEMGFDYHAGTRSGVGPGGYFSWGKFVNGATPVAVTTYATTDTTNEALAQIEAAYEPWLGYVAYNAPHVPFHAPPKRLHGYDLSMLTPEGAPAEHYRAAVEALDTQLGRLLAEIDPAVLANTLVVFVADNGTPAAAVLPPANAERAKKTPYEGGVRVPLIVSGPMIPPANRGAESSARVHIADLFATVQEAGAMSLAHRPFDSTSLMPQLLDAAAPSARPWRVAESFSDEVERVAVGNDCFKLLQPGEDQALELYDLCSDPGESTDLLTAPLSPLAQQNLAALEPYLDENPACDNGRDDDQDGAIDFGGWAGAPRDDGCAGTPWRASEAVPEPGGLGAAALAMIAGLGSRLQKRSARAS